MLFFFHLKILHKHCLQFLLGVKMAPRETENNAYAKFWGDKQRVLWYVMVFSGVVNRLLAPERVTFNWKNVTANQSKLHEVTSRILSPSYLMPQQQQALFTFRFTIIIVTEGSFSLTVSYMQCNKRKTKNTL